MFERIRAAIAPAPPKCELSIDQALHLMSNERRRLVVELIDELGPMTDSALADALATMATGGQYSADDRKPELVAVYQTHLPRLDDYDIVEWSKDNRTARPGENFDTVVAFVEDAQRRFDVDSDQPKPGEEMADHYRAEVEEVSA